MLACRSPRVSETACTVNEGLGCILTLVSFLRGMRAGIRTFLPGGKVISWYADILGFESSWVRLFSLKICGLWTLPCDFAKIGLVSYTRAYKK